MHKVMTIFGTRPEAIKLAPVIKELSHRSHLFESIVGVTGQHDLLLHQVLDLFHITPDFNLNVMQENQQLMHLTGSILDKLGTMIQAHGPEIILVQGDTTTVFAASLAAFYQKITVGHVEAGMRTNDKYEPFPEEMNRRLTDQMSDLFFAPTAANRRNLLSEGISDEKIHVTGNTVVDALLHICASNTPMETGPFSNINGKMILLTAHRRENFGNPLDNIFQAINRLAGAYNDFQFIFPAHPNPNVQNAAKAVFAGAENVQVMPPMDYLTFIHLMNKAYLILTDSGGIQEEAPSLHKPVLILRNKTERQEIVDAGGAILVGTNPETIVSEVTRLIEDETYYMNMVNIQNPYGDGHSAEKIVDILQSHLERRGPWTR
jgi:UDP-N-acetylglucosamine 2-epimerase (non-hydrolysing)